MKFQRKTAFTLSADVSVETQTSVMVAVNRGCGDYSLYLGGAYKDLLTGRKYSEQCVIEPYGFVVLVKIQ